MGRVKKGIFAIGLAVVVALGSFAVYHLANPIFEDYGLAVFAVREGISRDGKEPALIAYYQNRSGKECSAIVSFRLLDKDGKEIGIAYGEKYGPTDTPNGWFDKVVCPMYIYDAYPSDPNVPIAERTKDVDSWYIAGVAPRP